jgi:hypothetical protein
MSLRRALVLDHFYASLPADEFQGLLGLIGPFPHAKHQKVQTEAGGWEGLYIYSQSGEYFEILGDSQTIGLALSARSIQYRNASLIREEFPWIPWESGIMRRPNGSPWFEWCSPSSGENQRPALSVWTMRYFNRHEPDTDPPGFKRPSPNIVRFRHLHVLMGEARFGEIKAALHAWSPGDHVFGDARCLVRLPMRDGHEFTIEFERVPGEHARLQSLAMDMRPDVHLEPRAYGPFVLAQKGATATLSRRTPNL